RPARPAVAGRQFADEGSFQHLLPVHVHPPIATAPATCGWIERLGRGEGSGLAALAHRARVRLPLRRAYLGEAGGLQRGQDDARRGRLVEGVEVDTRGAAVE